MFLSADPRGNDMYLELRKTKICVVNLEQYINCLGYLTLNYVQQDDSEE
jgi:hypothetical protein